jgi:RimJ/RimL family protein N-acetyltransferase
MAYHLAFLRPSDLSAYSEIVCDPSTGLYDESFPVSHGMALATLEESIKGYHDGLYEITWEWQELALLDDQDGLVGLVSFKLAADAQSRVRKAKIGIHVHPVHRGKGAGRAALGLIRDKLASCPQRINVLEAVVDPENKPSLSLFRGYGFQEIGRIGADLWLVHTMGDFHV